ncbi:MAG: hypothetical protein JO316_18520 [Abitibacteriaceae bacterium]|nr:hypothetical protein [Abditibacteriaceae bacterium]MBV9867356.1 hypothetical protein [Abditibacteriaceae bacterium]
MALQLKDIYAHLSGQASAVTDEEACLFVQNLRVSYNAHVASLDYLAAVAHICHYKPHLLSKLFHYPANALICMGIATYEEAEASYIDYLLHDPKAATVIPLSPEARQYLEYELLHHKETINEILAQELRIVNLNL